MFKAISKYIKELKSAGLYGKAHKQHMCKNYEAALSTLDKVMSSELPEFLAILVLLERGEIEYRLGRYEASILNLNSFIEQALASQNYDKQIVRAKEFISAASSKT
ncbi:MAG: hypothetical protein QNK31_10955 [Porticoccus sp.]|nr:hypothetical protein [Porticoccus sp.]